MNTVANLGWRQLLANIESILAGATGEHHKKKSIIDSVSKPLLCPIDEQKAKIIRHLESYQSNQEDYKQYVQFSPSGYTKNLVTDLKLPSSEREGTLRSAVGSDDHHHRHDHYDDGDDDNDVMANVIVMCWAPRQASAFHGHESSRCFVKVLEGRLLEERVPHPKHAENLLTGQPERCVMSKNEVAYIDDNIGCHRVTNVSQDEPAITLHIYVPPYKKCRVFQLADNSSSDGLESSEGRLVVDNSNGVVSLTMNKSEVMDVFA